MNYASLSNNNVNNAEGVSYQKAPATLHAATPADMKSAIAAAFTELFQSMCELRNVASDASNMQTVNAWQQQVSAFEHQSEAAKKNMKASILTGAGKVIGGVVNTSLKFGGSAISKGVGKTERNARRAALDEAKKLDKSEQSAFLELNDKVIHPHRNFGLLSECSEAIGGVVSQPLDIGASIVGSGAKKLESVADFSKFNSNNALTDAKHYEEVAKSVSNMFATTEKMLESFAEKYFHAMTLSAA